jgi:D-sedoheptulose 7-phosphate isomerase
MRQAIETYLQEAKDLIDRFDRRSLQQAAEILLECHARGGRVWTMGNGGSASTAQHIACDLGKYVIPQGMRPFDARCLTDNISLYSAWANDAARDQVFVNLMRGLLNKDDVVILISVHGGEGFSQDLVHAAAYANACAATTIALVGFHGGPLLESADCAILVPVASTPHTEGLHVLIQHLLMHLIQQGLAHPVTALR